MKRILFYIGIVTLGFACREEDLSPNSTNFVSDLYNETTSLELVIGYEDDAEPYTEFNGNSAWDITFDNISDLLTGKNISLTIPRVIADMKYIGNLQQASFTNEELQALASELIQVKNQGSQKQLVVLFLDGYFNEDGQSQQQVIGLNIVGTPILAIFKPVIQSASPSTTIKTLVEQTTVCHEIGHALGLVDNGVPLTSDHKDEEHGAHCTNEDCVMYWQNSGGNVVEFVQPFLAGSEVDLFGPACIADVKAK